MLSRTCGVRSQTLGDGACARAVSGKASTEKPATIAASVAKAAAATTVRTLRARPPVDPVPRLGATRHSRSVPVSLVRGGDPSREDRAEEDRLGGAPLRDRISRGMTRPANCGRSSALGSRLSALGSRLSALGSRLSALGSRLSALGSRLSALGSRLSALGSRLSALGSRLSALGSRLSALGSRLSALGSRLSALGSRLSALTYKATTCAPRGRGIRYVRRYAWRHGLAEGRTGLVGAVRFRVPAMLHVQPSKHSYSAAHGYTRRVWARMLSPRRPAKPSALQCESARAVPTQTRLALEHKIMGNKCQ